MCLRASETPRWMVEPSEQDEGMEQGGRWGQGGSGHRSCRTWGSLRAWLLLSELRASGRLSGERQQLT